MKPTLHTGRPASAVGRLDREMLCYDVLDALQIPFQRADHTAANTIAECAAVEAVLGHSICKNLFLCNRQKTDFYLLAMPGDKPFRTKQLSHQINASRLSFADADAMLALLNLTPGSVSLLGLLHDTEHRVRLLLDRDLLADPWFCCHPCINTSTLLFRTADLLKKILPHTGHTPTLVELTAETEEKENGA